MLTNEEREKLFADPKAQALVQAIITFTEEGQSVVGRVVRVDPFEGGEFDTEVNKYTLTDGHQEFTCVLGAAADKALEKVGKLTGRVLAIKYKGKKAIKGGRQVNDFDIRDVSSLVKM